jgi:hypothetical protein
LLPVTFETNYEREREIERERGGMCVYRKQFV